MTLAEQVAEQFVRMIRTRRVKPGELLPTVRELSTQLQISIETAHKAYQLLKRDGWIISRPRHGTTVSPDLPSSIPMLPPKKEWQRSTLLQEMKKHAHLPGIIPVSGITAGPDERLSRALKEVATKAVAASFTEEEADPFGLLALRGKIHDLLADKGFWAETNSICMVNGTQQALWLLADQLISEGDVVGIPEMCYLPIKQTFQEKGARVIAIRQDGNGINLEHLETVCRTEKLKLLYTMPNAHYPTGESWSMSKKEAVLHLAAEWGFTLIEDEYFGELYYTPHPPVTLYSLAARADFGVNVYYTSSFSTIIHPNLRLGYMVLPPPATERFRHAKFLLDSTTSPISQQLLLHLWDYINFPESNQVTLQTRSRIKRNGCQFG
jgi:GntR family transcriptional regulator/MocR family aminotransferase